MRQQARWDNRQDGTPVKIGQQTRWNNEQDKITDNIWQQIRQDNFSEYTTYEESTNYLKQQFSDLANRTKKWNVKTMNSAAFINHITEIYTSDGTTNAYLQKRTK